jgi:hypothetical protein
MVVLTEVELLKSDVLPRQPTVTCQLCGEQVPATRVTPGSLWADGRQAFACTIHLLRDRRRWIIFWAAFDDAQRQVSAAKASTAERLQQ